jgi:hypothetical protein
MYLNVEDLNEAAPAPLLAPYTEEAAIRALARIPRTDDGPDWSRASTEDRALADRLFREDSKYLKSLALAEVGRQGGALRLRDRAKYLKPHSELYIVAYVRDTFGIDAGWDDIESQFPVCHHEAAQRFDPAKGVPWRGWLARIVPHRVRNYLFSGSTAGTVDHGDEPHREATFEAVEQLGLTYVFDAANDEVREAQNQMLSAFWFDRKPITKIATEHGIGKAAVSKRITKLRQTLPNLDLAINIERDVRRNLKRNRKETFYRESCTNYREGPVPPPHIGPRQLVLVEVADPERPPGAEPREIFANVEPVPGIDVSEALAEIIAEETAIRRLPKCKLGDRLDDYSEPGVITFRGPYVFGRKVRQKVCAKKVPL